MRMPAPGQLFVFEGPDGVGKSTLAKALVAQLNAAGHACEYVAFPGREVRSLGHHVYQLHHDHEAFGIDSIHPTSLQLLHIAAHIDAIEQRIAPVLRAGRSIVLDRFWWSTWVYGLNANIDAGVLDAMLNVERPYWNNIQPARIFLIRAPAPRDRDIPLEQWQKLSVAYGDLAIAQRTAACVQIVDNTLAVETTLAFISTCIRQIHLPNEHAIDGSHALEHQVTASANYQQVQMGIFEEDEPTSPTHVPVLVHLAPTQPTEVFDTYWRFAAERQRIFFQRLEGQLPPWSNDPIMNRYKFTNAYRASDRVSQYLIREVIYQGDQAPQEVFFRTMLFKIFNRIETWKLLLEHIQPICYEEYSFDRYDAVLTDAMNRRVTIFSAAYIMPSGVTSQGYTKKHRNWLKLLETMMMDEVPLRLADMRSMQQAFDLLRSYPMIGDFLAYQYVTDLNYSELTNFTEMEFVVPGPGARDGIHKCFSDLGGLSEINIIQMMADRQEQEFARLGVTFQSLWGRPLQLIDCQNLFCEVDKYARLAHPTIKGLSGRTRIKQIYQQTLSPLSYWYPPKWGVNERMGTAANVV